jgi:RNA polymerase sigma factor (sigma-70 family)
LEQESIHSGSDFDTLYRKYWPYVLRFCTRRLVTCPDGLAEEVAQDVFLAVHRALQAQRYQEEGVFSAWLLGIARHLCGKAVRDSYRRTLPLAVRALEGELAYLEDKSGDHFRASMLPSQAQGQPLQERVTWGHDALEHIQVHLQKHLQEAAHGVSPRALDVHDDAEEVCIRMRVSMQWLARYNRSAYTLLSMHVCHGVPIRKLATLQGLSRTTVARQVAGAKVALRTAYQAAFEEPGDIDATRPTSASTMSEVSWR